MRGSYAVLIIQGADQQASQYASRAAGFFGQNPWAKYALEVLAMVLAAGLVRVIACMILGRWADRLQGRQKHLVELSKRLMTPALAIAVFAGAFNLFPISDRLLRILNRVFYISILVLGVYCVAKVVLIVLDQWFEKDESRRALREPTEFAVRLIFAAFGTMILLENLGISLTSVWTTLGVGSVAIALALQDTLSNFFAGVYLRIDRPVSLGDYIKLQSGEEGYVDERGWRSTRIKALSGHIIIIPNSKMATTILTNYSLPNTRLPISVSVSVGFSADPPRVESLLLAETTAALGQIPGLPKDAAPSVQFAPDYAQNALTFTVNCTVSTYVDQYNVQNELRKRFFQRLREERIEFPVLQRDVRVVHEEGGTRTQMAADSPASPEFDKRLSRGAD